jgi:hypothetical protein
VLKNGQQQQRQCDTHRNTPTPRETELFAVELLNGGSGIAFRSCLQTYVGLNPKKKNKVRSASPTHPLTHTPASLRFRSSDRRRATTQKSARLGASATTAGVYETFYVSIKVPERHLLRLSARFR